MRVMIVGQKWLAAELLRLCLARGDDVAAVSAPRMDDRLAALASAEGIPVCQVPRRLTSEWVPSGIDVLLCAHAHVFVTAGARAKARFGALGYHPSLLPRHRGRDATRWAIHMGDFVSGGSAYWLDDGADTGPIAAQDWCWVKPGDTPEALWRRELAPMGLRLFSQVLAALDSGTVPSQPQDGRMATWEPSFTPGRLGEVA
ncbi:methionyl-tRNA formyltransferase [Acidovorax sp. GBBC 3332]|nr:MULTISPECIES: formyltransferase family protein [unclassified Acidovorax]MDA8449857.1 methionyl-tRNA formyltransferase [Acidovorax sp. GBBC 3297]MDA8459302.1 methionyl-tRNA formyltransferase [Acidovorax sp. GBBC 3333]MDA8464339.1 methionyl-tRNA formyltransferase [Acidovorax sp. GBBC 3332]MDA8469450.1 methionyl-tRNA formyltransferase [Acidovorax sp. GBBC 3299]